MSGRFIVIEGLDGCGSTTQLGMLAQRLGNSHTTAEPSTGPVGLFIREALRGEVEISDAVLPYLFAADRMDHLEREIDPALRSGKTVICDRYYGSSLAYQTLIAPFDKVATLNADFRTPDLTIFLDISPEQALERIEARGEAKERFETLSHLQEIASGYAVAMAYLQQKGENVLHLSALGTPEEVHGQVLTAVSTCLS